MVEVGTLQIGGSIDTTEIERGTLRIENSLKGVSEMGKSVSSDFERIDNRAKSLANTLGTMAVAGALAIGGLVKGAPALAGTMAKISLSMLKFKMAAGEALKPAFEIIGKGIEKLATWVDSHPDLFLKLTTSTLAFWGAIKLFNIAKISGLTTALTGFLGLGASAAFLTFVAAMATLAAAVITIGEFKGDITELRESGTFAEKVQYAATTGPLGAGPGAKGLDNLLLKWLASKLKRNSRNNSEVEMEYYT